FITPHKAMATTDHPTKKVLVLAAGAKLGPEGFGITFDERASEKNITSAALRPIQIKASSVSRALVELTSLNPGWRIGFKVWKHWPQHPSDIEPPGRLVKMKKPLRTREFIIINKGYPVSRGVLDSTIANVS